MVDLPNDMAPKRGRGRPKGSKAREVRKYSDIKPHKTKVFVPKIPLVYKFQRVSWLIKLCEERMRDDPLYIDSKKYIELLTEHEKLANQMIDKGLNTLSGRKQAKGGNYSGPVVEDGGRPQSSRMGGGKSAGVGSRVSAANPLGG